MGRFKPFDEGFISQENAMTVGRFSTKKQLDNFIISNQIDILSNGPGSHDYVVDHAGLRDALVSRARMTLTRARRKPQSAAAKAWQSKNGRRLYLKGVVDPTEKQKKQKGRKKHSKEELEKFTAELATVEKELAALKKKKDAAAKTKG